MTRRLSFWPVLGVIALIALALRLIGLDWDQGLYLHPDERYVVWVTTDLRWPSSVSEYFNTAVSPLNPYNTNRDSFVYGTFPSFLVKAIAGLFGKDSYGQLHLVGRAVSAIADTGTVVLTALLARRFFNSTAGLIAAVLMSFTPLLLQNAHFFTVDTISLFLVVAAFAATVRSWDTRPVAWMAIAGLLVGLAGASKLNFLAATAFLVLPMLESIRTRGWQSLAPATDWRDRRLIPAAIVGIAVALFTFRVAMPYAFAGPHFWNTSLNEQWTRDLSFWRAAQVGLVDIKPSIQWVDRTPVLYLIQNMVLWGMGPLLGITSLVAFAFAIWKVLSSAVWPGWWWIGILGWIAGNVALFGTGIAQNQRYLLPVYPFLILLAAGLLAELQGRFPRRWWPRVVTIGIVAYTMFFGVAFDSLYVRPITRIAASEWIYQNIPEGSVLSSEYWDDALPLPLPGHDRAAYSTMTLDLYAQESDDPSKVSTLVGQLSQVDYIVLSSNRVIDSVVRQPERYPVAVRYYEMLLSGELGFEKVADFRQGPSLLGISWDDRRAEESLIVYEHPEVRIFRKTEAFDAQHVHDELLAAWGIGGYHWIPGDPSPRQMLLSPEAIAINSAQGSWDDQVRGGFLADHPLLAWYLGMQIVGLAAWPLTWRASRQVADAGFAMGKAIGLIGTAAITLSLVTWRGDVFDMRTITLAIALLLALGLACPRCVWEGALPAIRAKWRGIVVSELVFLSIFLLVAVVRSYQAIIPDHQLMQLSALFRSSTLPPADPWMSGGILHVQWAGLLPWVALGKVLGLAPVVQYNLTIAGSVALLAALSWSLVRTLTNSWAGVIAPLITTLASVGASSRGGAHLWLGENVELSHIVLLPIVLLLIHLMIDRTRVGVLRLSLLSATAGVLASAASWGGLIALLLVAAGLAMNGWLRKRRADRWWPATREWALTVVGVLAFGLLAWWPARAAFTATARNMISPPQYTLEQLWQQFGVLILLVSLVTFVGVVLVLADTWQEGIPGLITGAIAVAAISVLLTAALLADSGLIMAVLITVLTVIAAWKWLRDREMLWVSLLTIFGLFMLIIGMGRPSQPDAGSRLNGAQLVSLTWLLLALAMSIFMVSAMQARRDRIQRALTVLASVLILAMLLIPSAFRIHESIDGQTSAGLANPHLAQPPGYASATNWLVENAHGMPVLLTAPGPGSSISAITGFPTVLGNVDSEKRMRPGWDSHVDRRASDVNSIYDPHLSFAASLDLLHQYGVTFIVIGETERATFGPQVETKFADAVDQGHLTIVFEENGVSIYRVVEKP